MSSPSHYFLRFAFFDDVPRAVVLAFLADVVRAATRVTFSTMYSLPLFFFGFDSFISLLRSFARSAGACVGAGWLAAFGSAMTTSKLAM